MITILKKAKQNGGNILILDTDTGILLLSIKPTCIIGLHPDIDTADVTNNPNNPNHKILITDGFPFNEKNGYAISLGNISDLNNKDGNTLDVAGGDKADIQQVIATLSEEFFYNPVYVQYL